MRATHTTARLQLPRARWIDLPTPVSATVVTFALIAIAGVVGRIQSAPAATVAVPTPGLIVVFATSAPVPPPQALYVPAAPAPRMVVAFASPENNVVLGPIPEPAVSAITGRWGDSYVSTLWQGATVWVRVSELGASLSNLAPAAPQIQPAPAQPIYQTSNQGQPPEPPPTPEPAQPALAPVVNAPPAAPVQQELPTIQPRPIPFVPRAGGPSETDYINVTTEWKAEHCFGSGPSEICTP